MVGRYVALIFLCLCLFLPNLVTIVQVCEILERSNQSTQLKQILRELNFIKMGKNKNQIAKKSFFYSFFGGQCCRQQVPLPYHSPLRNIQLCKYRERRSQSLLPLCLFTDYSREGRLYDMHQMHGKMFVNPRITKLNCLYVSRRPNNTQ